MKEETTVVGILNEVANDICKNYCKYPVIYEPTHIEDVDDDYMGRMFDEKCEQCPFRKLGL